VRGTLATSTRQGVGTNMNHRNSCTASGLVPVVKEVEAADDVEILVAAVTEPANGRRRPGPGYW